MVFAIVEALALIIGISAQLDTTCLNKEPVKVIFSFLQVPLTETFPLNLYRTLIAELFPRILGAYTRPNNCVLVASFGHNLWKAVFELTR